MATIVVTSTNSSGTGSLSAAVAQANANANADVITFDASLSGQSIVLTGELLLTNNVTITGDINGDGDADVTLGGTSTAGIIHVAAGVKAALSSLNIANASAKTGAIVNDGTLSLSYAVLSGNTVRNDDGSTSGLSVGAIVNSGVLSISQSVFDGNVAVGGVGGAGYYAVGSAGTHAAGAVVNLAGGKLTLERVAITDGTAIGGDGGRGGNGYAGAAGHSYTGYAGGTGGSAAVGVLNFGSMSGTVQNRGANQIAGAGAGGPGGYGSYSGASGPTGGNGTATVLNGNAGSGAGSLNTVRLGTQGADTVSVTNGRFDGLGGGDTLTDSHQRSQLMGGAGNDVLWGASYSMLRGGLGDDVVHFQTTYYADLIYSGIDASGGQGIDTLDLTIFGIYSYRVNYLGHAVSYNVIDLAAPGFRLYDSAFAKFENVIGGKGDEIILGARGINVLSGSAGNDWIEGREGADVLDGGAGTADILSFELSSKGVTVSLVAGTCSGGDARGDTFQNFEGVTGSAQRDKLTGDTAANILDGGGGNDTLTGGGGADTFVLAHDDTSVDTIADFVTGTDKLRIEQQYIDFALPRGPLAASALAINDVGAANDSDDRFILNSVTHELLFDADGNGAAAARLVAILTNVTQLTGNDFVIV